MPTVGFELTISAGERPQTYALHREATGTGTIRHIIIQIINKEINLVILTKKTGKVNVTINKKEWAFTTCILFSVTNGDSFSYIAPHYESNTGCPRRNVQYFGRVFLMLNYIDITQNTYIQSWTVTEIMAREVWNFDSCYTLIDYEMHIETGRDMWFL